MYRLLLGCLSQLKSGNAKNLQEKREILATIGSNFVLLDKILRISVPKPLVAIKTAKIEADKVVARFEPEEKTDYKAQLM